MTPLRSAAATDALPAPLSGRGARRWGRLALRLGVSGGLLALLLVILPWDEVATAASRMTVPLYAVALAGFVACHALGALKWRVMMAASGRDVRLGPVDTAGCYGAGLFSNLFLPTIVGGDVVRASLAARTLGRPESVVLGSMADRLIDFTALGTLLAGGALFAGAEMAGWVGPLVGIVGLVGFGVGVLFLPFALRRPLARWPRRFRRRIGRALVALRHLSRSPGSAALALTLALSMQSALILLSAWLGHAVGAHAPLWAWFFAWPLAKAAGMLPVTLGGLGVRDAALATLLVPFGVPAAFGVVASLVWNAVVIGGALVGGALWWIIRPGRRRVSAPDAATTAANSTPTANGTANATATGYAAATTAAGPRTVGASRPARSRLASAPGQAWTRYGGAFLWLVVAHAVVTAVLRLVPAFDALMHDPGAAIDVVIRYGEVLRWFDGQPIYAEATSADYPPASYVLLWPLIGWLAQGPMLVFYAVGLAATMAALGAMAVRASGATARSEKAFMAVFVLPLGATQIVVWIGQLGLHVTAAALGAAMILLGSGLVDRRARSLAADAAAAALLAFSLVKPTFAVPLVAGVLIVSGRMRPAVLTGAIYAGLTFLAAAFQERSAVGLAIDWLGREGILDVHLGSMNVYLWLHWMGFEGSMLPVSLLVLAVFLVWAWRHRRTAPLQVLGVSVIVSRLWVHHRVHDDVVLLILAIVLFRAAKERTGSEGAHPMLAAVLLAGAYGLGHAPWAYLSRGSPSLFFIVESGRTAVWLTALGLLVWQAVVHSRRRAEAAAS